MKRKNIFLISIVLTVLSFSCAIDQMAIQAVAQSLSEGADVAFSSDDDPELIGDAFPFVLKLYDVLLAKDPENSGLIVASGSGYIMYANAFLQTPAGMLPSFEMDKRDFMLARARKLYLRGRDKLLDLLEKRYPGFMEALKEDDTRGPFLQKLTKDDQPALYWAAAGWLAAASMDMFDIAMTSTVPQAESLLARCLELDELYMGGAVHGMYISYYASMPAGLGGDRDKALYHFERAKELTDGVNAGANIAVATGMAIADQDHELFKQLLEEILSVNPEDTPENRLLVVINQRKAKYLLDNIEEFFLLDDGFDDLEDYDEDDWEDREE